ncbi:AsmA family protein [Legionella israelensis]|uniref:AsmA family protein n=1 Tax=Legionella israelensis TaxID=454 RepID=A0AAX1EFR1_9GAMM|nr:AsmA family protein [Legionella israelensis]QBR83908.1 AsmA family protein [Legionella israelensis]
MKFLKKLVLIFFLLAIITAGTLWVLTKTLKPETVKQFVNSQLTSMTHKSSKIKGTIAWQLFPRPGIKVTQIEVGNPDELKDYSLTIDNLLLNLKITPLLRGQLVFSDININGLKLLTNPDENNNNSSTHKVSVKSQKPLTTTNQTGKFAIERFMLTNGQIIIQQKNNNVNLKNIQLGIEQFNLQKTTFPLQLKAKLSAESGKNRLRTNINFKGRLNLGPDIIQPSDEAIKEMTVNGQLLLQDIFFNQLKIDKLNANLKKEKNELILNPLTLSLYHGEAIGDLRYQLNNHQLTVNQTATNLSGKNLISSMIDKDLISGSLDYSFHMNIPLSGSMDKWSGKGNLTVKDGELKGIDLNQLTNQLIEKIDALIETKKFNLGNSLELLQPGDYSISQGNTPFQLARIQFHIAGDNLVTDSLIIQSERLHVRGSGSFNLQQREINSNLQATIIDNNENSKVYKVQNFLGGAFPIHITGKLEELVVLPDVKNIQRSLSHNLIKNALDKPVKEIEKKLKSFFH